MVTIGYVSRQGGMRPPVLLPDLKHPEMDRAEQLSLRRAWTRVRWVYQRVRVKQAFLHLWQVC